jgi:hypothetical protein
MRWASLIIPFAGMIVSIVCLVILLFLIFGS